MTIIRAQPDIAGTVTQLPLPRHRDTVRLTVRLDPVEIARLGEIDERLERYQRGKPYHSRSLVARSLVLDKSTHDFISSEAERASLSVNGFLARLLTDPELTTD